MSIIPERTLEGFVADSLFKCTEQDEAAVVKILEPLREQIEAQMEDYDEETQSWRDYRNQMWEIFVEENSEINKQVSFILGSD